MSTTSAFILTLYPYNFKLMKNFSRVSLYVSLVLEIPDGFHHLRLAVSCPLHVTKLSVFVNFNHVRLLGKATLIGKATGAAPMYLPISTKTGFLVIARLFILPT